MTNGFVNILKPTGMTSSDVVVITRGILRNNLKENIKVGHFGTLDPAGAGVLPVALGRATRLFNYTLNDRKIYRAGFRFGIETDTLDSYGNITKKCEKIPNLNDIIDILPNFIGKIEQIPPKFSSKSVDGKRAYDLARNGNDFELKGRHIEIYRIDFVEQSDNNYIFDIECSGGTYIRSVVRDVANALGTCAYMSFIIRKKSGLFEIDNSVTLNDFSNNPSKYILPIDFYLSHYPRINVPVILKDKVLNGVKVKLDNLPNGVFSVYVDGLLLGLGENECGTLKISTRLI